MPTITLQSSLVQGESLNLRAQVGDYPASSGWQLTLYLNPRAGGTARTVSSTADGDAHLLQATATTTAAWAAGAYGWEVWAALGAERYRLEAGQLQVLPSLIGAAAGTDTRTQAEIALDAAKAARAAWNPTVRRYKINGREMEFNSVDEVDREIRYWQARVIDEQEAARRAAGLPSRRKIHARMGRA